MQPDLRIVVVDCSGGGGGVFHLLGAVPHAAPHLHLLQPGRRPSQYGRQQGPAGGPLLLVGHTVLRQLRHQSHTLQHHVAQGTRFNDSI